MIDNPILVSVDVAEDLVRESISVQTIIQSDYPRGCNQKGQKKSVP